MYSTSEPYIYIKPVRSALTSFAVQQSEKQESGKCSRRARTRNEEKLIRKKRPPEVVILFLPFIEYCLVHAKNLNQVATGPLKVHQDA